MIWLRVVAVAALLGIPTLVSARASKLTAEEQSVARADVIDTTGKDIGTIAFVETPGGLLIQPSLNSLPQGMHGIHIHARGKCEPPDFESAGAHFNPLAARHGFLDVHGPHAGDLPNVYVGSDGRLEDHILTQRVGLTRHIAALFPRAEGAAIVIHDSADDYETHPEGAAGARIACGVIKVQAAEALEVGDPPLVEGAATEGRNQQ